MFALKHLMFYRLMGKVFFSPAGIHVDFSALQYNVIVTLVKSQSNVLG